MSNERTPIAWEYVREAIDRLPDANGPEGNVDTVEVAFTDADEAERLESTGEGEVVLEFKREVDTKGRWIWVYQGTVALDRDFMADTPNHRHASEWLRADLGARCLEVEVSALQGHAAM
jgi:hypothetical protein